MDLFSLVFQGQAARQKGNAMSDTALAAPRPVRCAIYARKSSEEGLDQAFNSLDAQREAAEAYVASQRQEGWFVVPGIYADGGFTGANMERPGLRKLMADIEAGHIDCVIVYKVDRLSRSLLDFARLMGVFEQHGVSFVSVTQQFNTSAPVGRLTLNILLSFAQFEKDLISERTRDKKAASKRKGMWTGGYIPFGYDLDPRGGKLVVNEGEAARVRTIFDWFAQHRSIEPTLAEIERHGWTTKSWVTAKQKRHQGIRFTEGTLRHLLTNEIYIGLVHYRGKSYRGEHKRIVDRGLWKKVQSSVTVIEKTPAPKRASKNEALLSGILHCGTCDHPMAHISSRRAARQYHYYVCRAGTCGGQSVPAHALESSILDRLEELAREPARRRLRHRIKALGHLWRELPTTELIPAIQALVERVNYNRGTGVVAILLRQKREKKCHV
jgi:site-specific DNA recombinase